MNTEILQQLNDGQRVAVEYCDGASLVIAGAGSGKTRVLTYKIAWLLEQGMAPWEILALTFTNKAAREMKERIGRLVGEERARYLQMGTFHSVFSRILRAEAAQIGYNANFTIYDQTDARSLVKTIIKEMNLDDIIERRVKYVFEKSNNSDIIYDGDDKELPFANGDYIFVPNIAEAVQNKDSVIKAYVVKDELEEFELSLGELTDDEREIILKGCLINYNRV